MVPMVGPHPNNARSRCSSFHPMVRGEAILTKPSPTCTLHRLC